MLKAAYQSAVMCLENDQGFYLWNAAWTKLVLPQQHIHIFSPDIRVSAICNSLSKMFWTQCEALVG